MLSVFLPFLFTSVFCPKLEVQEIAQEKAVLEISSSFWGSRDSDSLGKPVNFWMFV